jgi:iron complex outermembrane receptor protein
MMKALLKGSRLLFVFLICVGFSAFAQRTVTGKVTSAEDNAGIPGVNVIEKGKSNGTATDMDGNFSISVGSDAVLVFSAIGYSTQEVSVGSQTSVSVSLSADVTQLTEVIVTGYASQSKKELTSSVVSIGEKDFNRGNINDPTQLLQGKVPGLSIYNRGGNPNSPAVIRLRGISTVGANAEPLVVIDGVIGASLENVDPNDIESINVLKDGSAAAIYGSRGSSGVILVTTKRGARKAQATQVTYNGYMAAASVLRNQPVMTADEYIAAGGNDLGYVTDWQKEVTQTGISGVHNIALSGGTQNTSFRVSTNFRNIDGVLKKSGFDQINARANLSHRALNDRLTIDVNMSATTRNIQNSFNEALRYAVLFNPTAPIRFEDTGEFYQAILFDNFNPVAILEQNVNEGKRKTINFGGKVDYEVLKGLTVTANFGQQFESGMNSEYYSRSSLFRGLNRGGLARRGASDRTFSLFETYATYSKSFGNAKLDITGGYSFQEDKFEDIFIEMGNFPSDALGFNALQNAGDRISGLADNVNISSSRSPNNRIAATFARFNLTLGKGIFVNGSVRREGSTKLGEDNRFGVFPALGVGADLKQFISIPSFDQLKVRVGYGVTGSLPGPAGLAQDLYGYSFTGGGAVVKLRDANKDLKWEQKSEINVGVDFGLKGRLTGSLDVYQRDISDFILEREVDASVYLSGRRFENVGSLQTRGVELSLNYNNIKFGEVSWTPGLVLSSYKTTLTDFLPGVTEQMRSELGAPGQNGTFMVRVAVGEQIGQIWGPVFTGVETNVRDGVTYGEPTYKDINGDGTVNVSQGSALADDGDFTELGNGIPAIEMGWSNQFTYKRWDVNAFFRGAFGHSLVNNFRAFYEPIDPGAINSYNRVITDKAAAGLTTAKYSSLYVEKADFLKLDNLTVGYTIPTDKVKGIQSLRLYGNVQNAFVLTKYTGIDPEPVLQDAGSADNGGFQGGGGDVLAPGIDRRNNYFTSRTFTVGLTIGLK